MRRNGLHLFYLALLALSWYGFVIFAENSAWVPGLERRTQEAEERVDSMRTYLEDLRWRLGSMQVAVDSSLAWRSQRNIYATRLRETRVACQFGAEGGGP